MFQQHPSKKLNDCFKLRPFQGVDPFAARFLFIGLDANYDSEIELSTSFFNILDYHHDSVAFWRLHGVHHPFLLPEYRGDGRRYHKTFANIGFTPIHADLVSFVEMLHVPTVGRNKLTPSDLDIKHLKRINFAILYGNAKHIFISAGVASLMYASGVFLWLPKVAKGDGPLRIFYSDNYRSVYLHLHFSNYGKFQQQLNSEILAINELLFIGD